LIGQDQASQSGVAHEAGMVLGRQAACHSPPCLAEQIKDSMIVEVSDPRVSRLPSAIERICREILSIHSDLCKQDLVDLTIGLGWVHDDVIIVDGHSDWPEKQRSGTPLLHLVNPVNDTEPNLQGGQTLLIL